MWSKLSEVFEYIGLPYYRQGSLAEDDETPESYFTFWNDSTADLSHYDDEAHRIEWTWRIWCYTDNAADIYSLAESFISAATDKGFIVIGKGKDTDTASPTVFGRSVTVKYIENI